MSTLRTNAILDASGGTTATVNGYAPTLSNMAGRNRIINGDMRIDQRNAGAVVTAEGYLVDRWRWWRNQTYDVQRSTDAPTGFSNSLKATKTSTTQSTYAYFQHRIEGFNFSDLMFGTANAQSVTVSFWVKSSVTGTFSAGLSNDANNRTYPATYAISAANTWEYKTITIPGDTSGTWVGNTNGHAASVWFNFGASGSGTANTWNASDATSGVTGTANLGTTNGATFYITGVQLEAGSIATSFERRLYGQELALCQRYYWKAAGALDAAIGAGLSGSTTTASVYVKLPVNMRSAPTVTTTDMVITDGVSYNAAITSVTSAPASLDSIRLNVTCSGGGMTQYRPALMTILGSGAGFAQFSAEL